MAVGTVVRVFALLAGAAALVAVLVLALNGPAGPTAASLSEAVRCGAPGTIEAEEPGGREESGHECEDMDRELQEPADAMLQRVAFGSGGVTPPEVLRRAKADVRAATRRTLRYAPRVASHDWEFVGPANIGGRILDIALDPDDADTVYAATAGGGVFKSTDAGVTLVSAWPDDAPQAVAALVMTPSGVLYAGTGEAGPGGGSLTYGGDGVYRSTDRGRTWKRLPGLEKISRIGRIVVDPKDEKRLWVAGVGSLFHPTSDRGLYLSEDAGSTWRKVLEGDNQTTGAVDVAVDPSNPQRVFATMWDHQRLPDERRYNGSGSGVYRTLDGGRTWTRLASPVLGPNPLLGRMGIAVDPQQPDTVYVVASGHVGGHAGFFKSTDGGDTFLPIISAEQAGLSGAFTYGWWFGRVWVDPRNSSNVFVAGLDLLKSGDGGMTFASTSAGMHVDQHALVWDPRLKDRMYAGNDGGLYRSDNAGARWTQAKVQPFSQPDALDVSEQDPSRIVAGLQDNGEIRNYAARNGAWSPFGPGGDGQRVLINPKNKQIVYACGQNGACEVSTDGGNTGSSFENTIVSVRKAFFMPIEFDLQTPSTLYAGGEILSRSDDDGQSWTPISLDLSDGGITERETNPLYRGFGALTAIGTAPSTAGRLYAGTDDGNLWYANSGGGAVGPLDWTRASDPDLPEAYVTRIEVDQADPKVAYVTYSGFRGGDDAAYVLRTRDGGASWDNITGDLPRAPVNDLNIVGDKLVAASDFGMYATRDGGTHWYRVGRGLPLAPVYEMRTHLPSGTLFVATFGRSIWKIGTHALDGLPPEAPVAKPKPRRSFLGVPRLRPCRAGARLAFRVKAPKGVTLRSARIVVGKRTVRTLRGAALRRTVRVRLPRGKVKVRVVARDAAGSVVRGKTRTFKACRRR